MQHVAVLRNTQRQQLKKKLKTDPCSLYQVNELGAVIVILYLDDTLTIRDKPELTNTIGFINK